MQAPKGASMHEPAPQPGWFVRGVLPGAEGPRGSPVVGSPGGVIWW